MAGRSYGGRRESWRERGSSIFSDDDDDRRGRGTVREEERGFFERAGDEVRSWFGDQEAERRRERDLRRDEARSAFGEGSDGERGDIRTSYGGYGRSDTGGWSGYGRSSGGWEGSGYGGRPEFGRTTGSRFTENPARDADDPGRGSFGRDAAFASHWDDNYRRWREQQIEQFDREYDEYNRERQQRFDQEFDSWRTSRLTRGGSAGSPGISADAGAVDVGRAMGEAEGTTRSLGIEGAGATSGGGGTASAMRASGGRGRGQEIGAAGEDASQARRGRGRPGS